MEGVCILVHPPDTRLGLRGSVRMGGQQKVVDGIVGGVGGGFVEVALCAKLLCLFVDLPELDCFVCGVKNFENYRSIRENLPQQLLPQTSIVFVMIVHIIQGYFLIINKIENPKEPLVVSRKSEALIFGSHRMLLMRSSMSTLFR